MNRALAVPPLGQRPVRGAFYCRKKNKVPSGAGFQATRKGAAEASALLESCTANYIFFSEHARFATSHMPPAFSQSAWVLAVVTSPAKAGPVTAMATAIANRS